MTLTIPDVEQWQPEQLNTAATHAGDMSRNLDTAVGKGATDTAALTDGKKWSGTAGAAATTRMETEKTRSSAVSAAMLGLETALRQHVSSLNDTRAKVLQLRDDAIDQTPPFGVAPNGTVDTNERTAYYRSHADKANVDGLIFQDALLAASRTWELTNALKAAEDAAEQAKTTLQGAVDKLEQAFAELGEPTSNVAPPPPPPATTPASINSGHPVASSVSSNPAGGSPHSSTGSTGSTGDVSGTTSAPHQGPGSHAPSGPMPSGDMAQWIAEAKKELIAMGYDPKDIDERAIALIIEHESAGNPHAENLWDSNYLAGHPSKGLMQTIDSTFNSYKAPGHDDIWNPVDNIIAGVRYSMDRYGSLGNVPGVAAVNSGGAYQGY